MTLMEAALICWLLIVAWCFFALAMSIDKHIKEKYDNDDDNSQQY